MGLQEGSIAKWLKSEGDYVEAGEPLVEVDEAKVSDVISAPEAGYILNIIVEEGETVPVRTTLCLIGTKEELEERGLVPSQSFAPGQKIEEEEKPEKIESKISGAAQEKEIELTGVRGVIAHRMVESLRNSAQFTLTMTADVTDLLKQREKINENVALEGDAKVTLTDVLIKAIAVSLKNHPRLNGWVKEEKIILADGIHIGLGVAIEEGLMVPVLYDCDRKTLKEIAKETKQLAKKALEKSLSAEEVSGSTFTISNLGMYGIDFFTPIINIPEIAILGVGSVNQNPHEMEGKLIWRKVLPLSLTIDHRAVDGAPAAEFLRDFKDYLESIDLSKL